MKKISILVILLFVLYLSLGCPSIFDAIKLRLFADPEHIINRFYTERDLAEDQLIDSLILAGPKVVPLLECEILNKEIPRRLYAISALGHLGNNNSIPILEHILQDKSEKEAFRASALEAIASIDLRYAQKIASEYLHDTSIVAKRAKEVLANPTSLYKRSYWDALFHRHY